MEPPLTLSLHAWLALFAHYLGLSLLSIGGATTTAPEMHRYLVLEQGWLSAAQFNTSLVIAHVAPGPNALVVALMGWQIGLNAGGMGAAALGVLLALGGFLLPSTILAILASGWIQRHRHWIGVQAFRQGMGPTVVGLMLATGWLLAEGSSRPDTPWTHALLTACSALVILRWRRIPLIVLLAIGAGIGWAGIV